MKNNSELRDWLTLSLIDGLTPRARHAALRAFGGPGAALKAPAEAFCEAALRGDSSGERAKKARAALKADHSGAVAATLKWLAASDSNAIITLADERYPAPLTNTPDAPILLYARGDLSLLAAPMVAVVGSRGASAAGLRNTEIFARALAQAGCSVVSGLAEGVDAMAHKGALAGAAGGGTIAVIGTGIDIVYPRINRPLASDIAKTGLLLSEFALGTRPVPYNFPRRNRIISGLSAACVVMEATLKSGSLITARLANEYGREVFAVPGSINSPLHRGCHRLIREGATLAESAEDVLRELGMELAAESPAQKYEQSRAAGVAVPGGALLQYINYQPTSVDDISTRSGSPTDMLMPLLLELELAGKIVATAGGGYQRV